MCVLGGWVGGLMGGYARARASVCVCVRERVCVCVLRREHAGPGEGLPG